MRGPRPPRNVAPPPPRGVDRARVLRAWALAAWLVALSGVHPLHAQAPATAMRAQVLVVGSEPEAIVAAVAAAEEGARTVLLTPDARLGGLFVLGELNVLDLRTEPTPLQAGVFARWWALAGGRPAFDVDRGEAAFERLLRNAGVEVVRGVPLPVPVRAADGRLLGARAGATTVLADQIIDGGGDADFAAAAGAPFDIGWGAFHVQQRQADTLVFALHGVDWSALSAEVRARGHGYASVRDNVAWGGFGGYPGGYRPTLPGLRLRGLNLGRESDGTVLVNALLIYGSDPLDADSREAARERAASEVPDIVRYLSAGIPGFEHARFAGVAPRLYVRESRHLRAQCTLRADDVLDNRVTPWDVAAGGYPLDVQSLTPYDTGYVFGTPEVYGGRLCMAVAPAPAPLWVVGRAAGFDPVAYASARVVPFGMAMAEGVGVAAAEAARRGLDPWALAADPEHVTQVRARLEARGAYLAPVRPRAAEGPVTDPAYDAFRLLLSRGLAVGGYDNAPALGAPMTRLGFLYLLGNVAQRFFGDGEVGRALVARFGTDDTPLRPEDAYARLHAAACAVGPCPPQADGGALQRAGLLPGALADDLAPNSAMTRGQAYRLAAALAARAPR